MSEDLGLGKIITSPQQRDSIHIAVAPVIAAANLVPGMKVVLNKEGRAKPAVKDAIGVVDPYLTQSVPTGSVFWLFLNPGSITSLRHDWTHPAFVSMTPAVADGADVVKAKLVLRDIANSVEISYDGLIKKCVAYLLDPENTYHTMSFDTPDVDTGAMWEAIQTVTGIIVPQEHKDAHFFSCSC